MTGLTLKACEGIDTRTNWELDDRFALLEGDNIQIQSGGSITCRPARVKVADLSASSVGLYARGGKLRALVPSGLSLQTTNPTEVIYDGIGQGGTFDYSGKIGAIVGAETFGTSSVHGPHGYVAFARLDNGAIEHHWIKEPPASAASFVSTKVELPFQPGRALSKIATKIVAPDPGNGYVRYCSSLDPTDWTTSGDAGFENVIQHVDGSRDVTALGIHRGALAVFFSDATQLWFMDVTPANNYLKEILNGPGTDSPGSVSNAYGDALFLGSSGFSNLATANQNGQADFNDLGDGIRSITKLLTTGAASSSIWSQKRSQYLCAIGTTIFCLSYYQVGNGKNTRLWTKWTMPESIDYLVENAGTIYYRSGNVLYSLDDTVGRDTGASADIAWNMKTRNQGFPRVGDRVKQLNEIVPQCTARCTYTPICDNRELTGARVTFPGNIGPMRSKFSGSGRRIGVRMAGSGLMQMDGVFLGAEVCDI